MTVTITNRYERNDTPTSMTEREVTFLQYSDDGLDQVFMDQRISLDRGDYIELGEPEQITVTITSGG